MKKFLNFRLSKSKGLALNNNEIQLVQDALNEYLENRLYDLDGINIEDITSPQVANLSWFFDGLAVKNKLISHKRN